MALKVYTPEESAKMTGIAAEMDIIEDNTGDGKLTITITGYMSCSGVPSFKRFPAGHEFAKQRDPSKPTGNTLTASTWGDFHCEGSGQILSLNLRKPGGNAGGRRGNISYRGSK